HGRDTGAAVITVHHDRRAGRVEDDRADRAGRLGMLKLDLNLAAAALDQRNLAVEVVRVADRLARVVHAAVADASRIDAVIDEYQAALDRFAVIEPGREARLPHRDPSGEVVRRRDFDRLLEA